MVKRKTHWAFKGEIDAREWALPLLVWAGSHWTVRYRKEVRDGWFLTLRFLCFEGTVVFSKKGFTA